MFKPIFALALSVLISSEALADSVLQVDPTGTFYEAPVTLQVTELTNSRIVNAKGVVTYAPTKTVVATNETLINHYVRLSQTDAIDNPLGWKLMLVYPKNFDAATASASPNKSGIFLHLVRPDGKRLNLSFPPVAATDTVEAKIPEIELSLASKLLTGKLSKGGTSTSNPNGTLQGNLSLSYFVDMSINYRDSNDVIQTAVASGPVTLAHKATTVKNSLTQPVPIIAPSGFSMLLTGTRNLDDEEIPDRFVEVSLKTGSFTLNTTQNLTDVVPVFGTPQSSN
jgi:hypothetical protein